MAKRKFKLQGSLSALLFTMAERKAIDQLRAGKQWKQRRVDTLSSTDDADFATVSINEDLETLERRVEESAEVDAAWKALAQSKTPADEVATAEVIRQFRIWLGTLPNLQRKVAQALYSHSGDITDNEIAEEIGASGPRPPISSIKSARAQIRTKFDTLMKSQERKAYL